MCVCVSPALRGVFVGVCIAVTVSKRWKCWSWGCEPDGRKGRSQTAGALPASSSTHLWGPTAPCSVAPPGSAAGINTHTNTQVTKQLQTLVYEIIDMHVLHVDRDHHPGQAGLVGKWWLVIVREGDVWTPHTPQDIHRKINCWCGAWVWWWRQLSTQKYKPGVSIATNRLAVLPVVVYVGSSGCSMLPTALGGACWPQGTGPGQTPVCKRDLNTYPYYNWPETTTTQFSTSAPAKKRKKDELVKPAWQHRTDPVLSHPYMLVSCTLTVVEESPKSTAVEIIQDGQQEALIKLKGSRELQGGRGDRERREEELTRCTGSQTSSDHKFLLS